MLFVVAWPILSEADDTALRRLRAQYHPREADLIGPHFTLVFGVGEENESRLRESIGRLRQRPFWFVLDRIVRFDQPPPSRVAYLYAEPREGTEELAALHDCLNIESGGEPFEAHVTLGLFERAVDAEQVARIVERQHLPIHGRVEELSLLRRDGARLETLTTIQLGE